MISKNLKIRRLEPDKLRNKFQPTQIKKKSRVCTVQYMFTVTPIPCYLFQAAQLVRIKNGSVLSSHYKNQKIADGRVKYDGLGAAWVRVKEKFGHVNSVFLS